MMIPLADSLDIDTYSLRTERISKMFFSSNKKGAASSTVNKALCLLLSALMLAVSLASCGGAHNLKNEGDGVYVDKGNGSKYHALPGSYEPASIGAEYGKLGDYTLYEIGGLDPKEWLCEKDSYNIFVSTGITPPSFEQMTVTEIKLCYQDKYTMEFASIKDEAEIARISDAYINGEAGLGFAGAAEHVVAIKVRFKECPEIYYCFNYVYSDSGEAYLTNRYEGKIIRADGLLDTYIVGGDTETESESK